LSRSASITGKISRVTFNRGLKVVLETPKIQNLSEDKQYILVKNYFKAVENNIHDFKLVLKSAYFEAFCAIFDEVLEKSYSLHRDYKEDSLNQVLSKISNFDIAQMTTAGRTKITKGPIISQLRAILFESPRITEDQI
jgi:hypothetical protein